MTERIKTFYDACKELGEEHPYVKQYDLFCYEVSVRDKQLSDVIAYLKLRIICAALNEGWEPQFSEYEVRWYPWYFLCTNKELEAKSDEWKQTHTILSLKNYRVVGRAGYDASAGGGVVYANAYYASSYSYTGYGSRLAFKSEKLAEYAGKQFIEIYADFLLIRK